MRNRTGRPMNEDSMKKIVGRLYYLSKDGWDIPKILGWLVRANSSPRRMVSCGT